MVMNTRRPNTAICILIIGLLISGCGPAHLVAIAVGDDHTCALNSDGGVKCWLYNQIKAVNVSGLTREVRALAAGWLHTCALTQEDGVKCWGNNQQGQLGDSTTIDRINPVDVVGLTRDVIAISAAQVGTCALTSAGEVKCWGNNGGGILGRETSNYFAQTPVAVSGLPDGVSGIFAGDSSTCAIISGIGVKCWGCNFQDQIPYAMHAEPFFSVTFTPVDVSGLAGQIRDIAPSGYHACALTSAGGVKCWGQNVYGELGDGTTINRITPMDVIGLTSSVVAISAGEAHTCALTLDGRIL